MLIEEELAIEQMCNAHDLGQEEGWRDCLDAVRASIVEYPNGGGDIVIMTEIERIEREAYWQGVFDEYDTELNCDLGNTISVDFTKQGALWIK